MAGEDAVYPRVDVSEARLLKAKLESKIATMIHEFNAQTGMYVINMHVSYSMIKTISNVEVQRVDGVIADVML